VHRPPAPLLQIRVAALLACLAGGGCELIADFDRSHIASAPDATLPSGGAGGASPANDALLDAGADAGPDASADAASDASADAASDASADAAAGP
jgi:hypothetical protein